MSQDKNEPPLLPVGARVRARDVEPVPVARPAQKPVSGVRIIIGVYALSNLNELLEYLNSEQAQTWIEAHAQKAHNNYYRMQSKVLNNIPVPEELSENHQSTLPTA